MLIRAPQLNSIPEVCVRIRVGGTGRTHLPSFAPTQDDSRNVSTRQTNPPAILSTLPTPAMTLNPRFSRRSGGGFGLQKLAQSVKPPRRSHSPRRWSYRSDSRHPNHILCYPRELCFGDRKKGPGRVGKPVFVRTRFSFYTPHYPS